MYRIRFRFRKDRSENFISRKNGELIFSHIGDWFDVSLRKKRNGMRTAFVPRWLVTRDRFSNGFLAPILAWQNCIRKCILHIGSTTYNLPPFETCDIPSRRINLGFSFFFFFFVICNLYKFCDINSRRNRKKKKKERKDTVIIVAIQFRNLIIWRGEGKLFSMVW